MYEEIIVFYTLTEVKDHLLQTRLNFKKFSIGCLLDDLHGARNEFKAHKVGLPYT